MKGINMSVANELFEKTNALAGKLPRNPRVVISKPQRIEPDIKPALPKGHRYSPEDRPPPLSEVLRRDQERNRNCDCEKNPPVPEHQPLAHCPICRADRPMKWKPREKRGKTVEEWFVCAVCGCERLEIKIISPAKATEMNKIEPSPAEKNEMENISIPHVRCTKYRGQKFIEENLVEENKAYILSGKLYEDYVKKFCRPNGYRPLSATAFFRMLKEVFPNAQRMRKRIDGGHHRIWLNIRMKPRASSSMEAIKKQNS